MSTIEFSHLTRKLNLSKLNQQEFDFLIIGGGITGAAVARDAISRGLKVALVEARDFAWGTSSRSSKLIHGGLRYLENFEFGLVFEALSERAHLLKTASHLVNPLTFYLPVYKSDTNGKALLNLGLWFYDFLSLFRGQGIHSMYSKKRMLEEIPFLKSEGLKGGFKYFDASMWDDLLVIDTLRDALRQGAVLANYVEAIQPIWNKNKVSGFVVKDKLASSNTPISVKAKKVIVCAGPWTDELGQMLDSNWKPWLSPSKGVHLIFDLKKIPIPGATVMSHPQDGRISFVIPRPDFGAGVVIVGTTDGPTKSNPQDVDIDPHEVNYLIDLLNLYFPKLNITYQDIISAYVGIRPLMGEETKTNVTKKDLKSVSREHFIGDGPGKCVMVCGGKYTTHRTMAEEIVDYAIESLREDLGKSNDMPTIGKSKTKKPVNRACARSEIRTAISKAREKGWKIPGELIKHYGADSFEIMSYHNRCLQNEDHFNDPKGFPMLKSQLRYAMNYQMVLRLEDFYFRRMPLYLSLKDHGQSVAFELALVWASEFKLSEKEAQKEYESLISEINRRNSWIKRLEGTLKKMYSQTPDYEKAAFS